MSCLDWQSDISDSSEKNVCLEEKGQTYLHAEKDGRLGDNTCRNIRRVVKVNRFWKEIRCNLQFEKRKTYFEKWYLIIVFAQT